MIDLGFILSTNVSRAMPLFLLLAAQQKQHHVCVRRTYVANPILTHNVHKRTYISVRTMLDSYTVHCNEVRTTRSVHEIPHNSSIYTHATCVLSTSYNFCGKFHLNFSLLNLFRKYSIHAVSRRIIKFRELRLTKDSIVPNVWTNQGA